MRDYAKGREFSLVIAVLWGHPDYAQPYALSPELLFCKILTRSSSTLKRQTSQMDGEYTDPALATTFGTF